MAGGRLGQLEAGRARTSGRAELREMLYSPNPNPNPHPHPHPHPYPNPNPNPNEVSCARC
eukprot:scaffold96263_cov55-Phaeocystis_antarctica.AAC.2